MPDNFPKTFLRDANSRFLIFGVLFILPLLTNEFSDGLGGHLYILDLHYHCDYLHATGVYGIQNVTGPRAGAVSLDDDSGSILVADPNL